MSQSLTINNREYIPAGEVGRHFGYTRDYILTLSREGKIDGQKIGHRWYVNLESARAFFEAAKSERENRRQIVSEVRKAELRSYQSTRPRAHASTALTETLAILAIGLLIGATGYLGTTTAKQQAALSDSDLSFFRSLAVSLYDLFSPEEKIALSPAESASEQAVAELDTAERSKDLSLTYAEVAATTTYTSLVIAPDQVLTTTTIQTIRDSLSDDVSVSMDPHDPDSGVIIPRFKNRDGEAYRFLMVPVIQGDQP